MNEWYPSLFWFRESMIAVVNAAGAHDGLVELQMFTQVKSRDQHFGYDFPA
jgi:hypothetical protein